MGAIMANELADGLFSNDMETSIGIHLRANHYPPVPLSMVPVCVEAIDAYWEDDSQRQINLPEGVLWRGNEYAPAWAIIESHHLDAWCQDDFVEEDYE